MLNDHKKAKNETDKSKMGSIEIGMISNNAPMANTPTIKPTEPHLRTLP